MSCDLAPCLTSGLQAIGINAAALDALDAGVVASIAAIQTTLDALNAALIAADVSLAPIQIEYEAAKALMDLYKSKLHIIPTDLAKQCPQLNQVNILIDSAFAAELAAFEDLIFRLNRILATKNELAVRIQILQDSITFLTCVHEEIGRIKKG